MIVIDTSALLVILNQEPERAIFYNAIATADRCLVSAVSYQEAGHVIFARRGVNGLYDLEDLLSLIGRRSSPMTYTWLLWHWRRLGATVKA